MLAFLLVQVEEYLELEEKLKRSIVELEKKEKQLVTAETEVRKTFAPNTGSSFVWRIVVDWRSVNLLNTKMFLPQLLRMKDEQKREYDGKMVELREASRRMKEDCEHLVELER